jgi:hypothetical protein
MTSVNFNKVMAPEYTWDIIFGPWKYLLLPLLFLWQVVMFLPDNFQRWWSRPPPHGGLRELGTTAQVVLAHPDDEVAALKLFELMVSMNMVEFTVGNHVFAIPPRIEVKAVP